MSDSVALLKLEAVSRVAERLLRVVAEQPDCETFYPINDVATELRDIVDAVVPSGKTPTERALAELAFWSVRHGRAVDAEALESALLSELVSLQVDAGRSRGDFLARCAQAYDSLSLVRAELDALVTGELDRLSSESQG